MAANSENSTDVAVYEARVSAASPADVNVHVVVDIPEEPQEQEQNTKEEAEETVAAAVAVAERENESEEVQEGHPLDQIVDSGGHLLQMKLWQRDQDAMAAKIEFKELRLERIRAQIFHVCCVFFFFNGLLLTLLFMASANHNQNQNQNQPHWCSNRWWIPSSAALAASIALTITIEYKMLLRDRIGKKLSKDRADLRTLARSVQELRMKGVSFPLPKDPQAPFLATAPNRQRRSSSVDCNAFRIFSLHLLLVPLALFAFSASVLAASKFIACSSA